MDWHAQTRFLHSGCSGRERALAAVTSTITAPIAGIALRACPPLPLTIAERITDYRCYMYDVVMFSAAVEMIEWLREHGGEVIAVSLDHDLEIATDATGKSKDCGTGREVAEYLATQTPMYPVLIASTNVPAAIGMEQLLADGGWTVARITPYEDLLWVGEAWWPEMRRLLLGAAVVTNDAELKDVPAL